jgi:hypothetical protein
MSYSKRQMFVYHGHQTNKMVDANLLRHLVAILIINTSRGKTSSLLISLLNKKAVGDTRTQIRCFGIRKIIFETLFKE